MSKATVLVVEDDEALRDAIVGALLDRGHHVGAVADGGAALAYLLQGHALPAVILLDMMMPIMSGWTFLNELRRTQSFATIPLVIMSAYLDQVSEAVTSHLSVTLLPKPFAVSELLAVVHRYTPRGQQWHPVSGGALGDARR